MDRARLGAFSDGVFAVAITLLALDLSVAGPGHGTTLLHQLGHRWPAYAAHVVSFSVIGVPWVNHRSLFVQVARVDRPLLFANLLLLLFVVAIPFITSTPADYLLAGGQDATVAAVLSAVVMEGMGLSFSLMFAHVVRAGLLAVPLTPEASRSAIVGFGLGGVAYLVSIVGAFLWAPFVLVVAGGSRPTTSSNGCPRIRRGPGRARRRRRSRRRRHRGRHGPGSGAPRPGHVGATA